MAKQIEEDTIIKVRIKGPLTGDALRAFKGLYGAGKRQHSIQLQNVLSTANGTLEIEPPAVRPAWATEKKT